jgi:hypothetical protein
MARTPSRPSGSIIGITLEPAARPCADAARGAPPPVIDEPPIAAVTPMEISMKHMADSEPVRTMRNLPSTMSTRATGLHRSVSIVPRSFSPAVKSIAGYMAPLKQRIMIRYGTSSAENIAPDLLGRRDVLPVELEGPGEGLGQRVLGEPRPRSSAPAGRRGTAPLPARRSPT